MPYITQDHFKQSMGIAFQIGNTTNITSPAILPIISRNVKDLIEEMFRNIENEDFQDLSSLLYQISVIAPGIYNLSGTEQSALDTKIASIQTLIDSGSSISKRELIGSLRSLRNFLDNVSSYFNDDTSEVSSECESLPDCRPKKCKEKNKCDDSSSECSSDSSSSEDEHYRSFFPSSIESNFSPNVQIPVTLPAPQIFIPPTPPNIAFPTPTPPQPTTFFGFLTSNARNLSNGVNTAQVTTDQQLLQSQISLGQSVDQIQVARDSQILANQSAVGTASYNQPYAPGPLPQNIPPGTYVPNPGPYYPGTWSGTSQYQNAVANAQAQYQASLAQAQAQLAVSRPPNNPRATSQYQASVAAAQQRYNAAIASAQSLYGGSRSTGSGGSGGSTLQVTATASRKRVRVLFAVILPGNNTQTASYELDYDSLSEMMATLFQNTTELSSGERSRIALQSGAYVPTITGPTDSDVWNAQLIWTYSYVSMIVFSFVSPFLGFNFKQKSRYYLNYTLTCKYLKYAIRKLSTVTVPSQISGWAGVLSPNNWHQLLCECDKHHGSHGSHGSHDHRDHGNRRTTRRRDRRSNRRERRREILVNEFDDGY